MKCRNMFHVVVPCVVALCALSDLGPSTVLAEMYLTAKYDMVGNYKVCTLKKELTLECQIEGATDKTPYVLKWFKSGPECENEVKTDGDEPHRVSVYDNKLKISRFLKTDVGTYTCKLYNKDGSSESVVSEKNFNVVATPYTKLPKTVTFIEGEKMELECVVYGLSEAEVSWKFENNILVPNERVKFTTSKRNVSNAVLVLDPVNMNDRGNYVCSGKNYIFVDPVPSDVSYVRIRGKMAALWPFLGICVEVIILSLIIYIYEKKRDKTEFKENDSDLELETNNATKSDEGPKYRKISY